MSRSHFWFCVHINIYVNRLPRKPTLHKLLQMYKQTNNIHIPNIEVISCSQLLCSLILHYLEGTSLALQAEEEILNGSDRRGYKKNWWNNNAIADKRGTSVKHKIWVVCSKLQSMCFNWWEMLSLCCRLISIASKPDTIN